YFALLVVWRGDELKFFSFKTGILASAIYVISSNNIQYYDGSYVSLQCTFSPVLLLVHLHHQFLISRSWKF
ncbi:hypothetical protein FRX31_013078, partial [Thalictrum thalictroides]